MASGTHEAAGEDNPSYVTTLTVYADYFTEGDGGKAAPLCRPVPSSVTNVVPMRRPG
ncbi:MAG: hypothetical protein ACRDTK_09405 [Mycobacterium sp.]